MNTYKNNYGESGAVFGIYNYFYFNVYDNKFDENFAKIGGVYDMKLFSPILG